MIVSFKGAQIKNNWQSLRLLDGWVKQYLEPNYSLPRAYPKSN